MAYLIAVVLISAIVFFLYKVIVAPAEEVVDVKKGPEAAKLPEGARAVATFPSATAQVFTNDASRLVENAAGEGFGAATTSTSLKYAIKSGGWVIIHLPLGGADWKGQRRLHLLARGAKAPTAIRVVAQTDAGEFFAWHDNAFASADWALLTIPFAQLVDGQNRGFAGQSVTGLNLEIHPDRKMALRGEEERHLLIGGVWLSAA